MAWRGNGGRDRGSTVAPVGDEGETPPLGVWGCSKCECRWCAAEDGMRAVAKISAPVGGSITQTVCGSGSTIVSPVDSVTTSPGNVSVQTPRPTPSAARDVDTFSSWTPRSARASTGMTSRPPPSTNRWSRAAVISGRVVSSCATTTMSYRASNSLDTSVRSTSKTSPYGVGESSCEASACIPADRYPGYASSSTPSVR